MILSGQEIQKRLGSDITIEPFETKRLNPNSYDLTLHNELMIYEEVVLDMKKANRVRRMEIPADGLVLRPGELYLGRTFERIEVHNLVPMVEGRSSVGRLGLHIHVSAGFGNVGFNGYWTLEIHSLQPVRIYAGVPICQIIFHEIVGEITEYESNKYQHNRDIQPSLLFKELNPDADGEDDSPQMKLPLGIERSH